MSNLFYAKATTCPDTSFMTDCCHCNFSYKLYVEMGCEQGYKVFSESVYDLHYESVVV